MSFYNQGLGALLGRAALNLTDMEADAWTLMTLLEGPWPKSTKQIFKAVQAEPYYRRRYSYRTVTRSLTLLVSRGLAIRVRQGHYKPVLGPLFEEALNELHRGGRKF